MPYAYVLTYVPSPRFRLIPIISDEYVDMTFGTGALKVTPAHDINDYEIGKRHNLRPLNMFNKDATVNTDLCMKEKTGINGSGAVSGVDGGGSKYNGLDRFIARDAIWEDLKSAGLGISKIPHLTRVPRYVK